MLTQFNYPGNTSEDLIVMIWLVQGRLVIDKVN